MNISLKSILMRVISTGFRLQSDDGSFPPSHNGPYFQEETPARNTAHWIILLAYGYLHSEDSRYLKAIRDAADYLVGPTILIGGQNFQVRKEDSRLVDGVNGVIGAAWLFEALAAASLVLEDPKYKLIAIGIFHNHKFNKRNGLWHRHLLNGRVGRIDQTFNHQLWFAATSAGLFDEETLNVASHPINRFLSCLTQNLTCYENGLIYHPLIYQADLKSKIKSLLDIVLLAKDKLCEGSHRRRIQINYEREMFWKSVGYHSFNLYAFYLLYQNTKFHQFWVNGMLDKSLELIGTDDFWNCLDVETYYGWLYNLPGFEVPVSLQLSKQYSDADKRNLMHKFVQKQFSLSFELKSMTMGNATFDASLATAKLYELTRLEPQYLDIEVTIK